LISNLECNCRATSLPHGFEASICPARAILVTFHLYSSKHEKGKQNHILDLTANKKLIFSQNTNSGLSNNSNDSNANNSSSSNNNNNNNNSPTNNDHTKSILCDHYY
jgi:hypothetical protein